ncbi:MAG TPA: acetyl-CoA acetyltransferase [Casimicrobiaceae bacterium]|nr:acetyl-CoA acetyltransferase [Casimicrobiaceae bacterium]
MTGPSNMPVLVGIGTATRREDDWRAALEPLDLMLEAVREAGRDSGVPAALEGAGYISVPRGRWKYANPAGAIARAIGAREAVTVLATPGVLQQTLIGEACVRIANGEIDTAIITGADAGYRILRAQIAGEDAPESVQDDAPQIFMKPKDELRHPVEKRAGMQMPVGLYAILESAYRAKQGWAVDEHRDRLAELYSRMSRIAERNPHAWNRTAVAAADVRDASRHNPMQAFPYTRYHCSTWNVDQACALLLCSAARADALGIEPTRRVYPLASTESNHMIAVSARGDVASLPGARIAGRAALEIAGLSIDEIDLVELYSCFPIAIELYADAFGLPLTRELTITGGMSFAGGPYNNYFLQATCRGAELLRAGAGRNALLSCVSGIVTKQAFGVWSVDPPARPFGFRDVSEQVARESPVRAVIEDYVGDATIAGYTVIHSRGQAPKGVALVDDATGRRAMATTEEPALVARMQETELVGRGVRVEHDALVAIRSC